MPKYFVYYGHITCDNCDSYPMWKLVECDSIEQVNALKDEWYDPDIIHHGDCDHCIFKVIEGIEYHG